MNVTDVNNNLKIISDAKSLHLKEFAWTYVLPVTCLVGFVANVINIYVFLQLKPDRLNKYCLIHSISYLLYTFFCFFSFLIRCGSLCQTGSTYFAKLYEYIVFNYMTSVLAIFSILIESCISFERYLLVTNGYFKSSSGKKLKFKYVLFILIVFSLLFYVPSVFTEEILQNRDNTTGLIKYSLELSQFGRSSQGTSVLIFLSAIRNLILLIINLIINLFTVMAFRRYIKNRQKIRIPSTKSGKFSLLLSPFGITQNPTSELEKNLQTFLNFFSSSECR